MLGLFQRKDRLIVHGKAPYNAEPPLDRLRWLQRLTSTHEGHAEARLALAEAALDFALRFLAPGGCFVAKMLQGSGERGFVEVLRRHFEQVARVKPPSSRRESSEFFLVAKGRRAGSGGL